MIKIPFLQIALYVIILHFSAFSKRNVAAKFEPVSIKFHILDTSLIGQKPKLTIYAGNEAFGGVEFYNSNIKTYEQEVFPHKDNQFIINTSSKYLYLVIAYPDLKSNRTALTWIDAVFVIEAGSNLICEVDDSTYKFSGKGSGVLNLQSQLISLQYNSKITDKYVDLLRSRQFFSYHQFNNRILDSIFKIQKVKIMKEEINIGKFYTKMLIANAYGLRYFNQIRSNALQSNMMDTGFVNSIYKYYGEKGELGDKAELDNNALEKSPIYTSYIIEEMLFLERLKVKDFGGNLTDISISHIIKAIETKYNGVLKDKLLTLLMIRLKNNPNSSHHLSYLISKVSDPKYHGILNRRLTITTQGLPFKDFKLLDSTNTIFTLKSFSGKVVIMDFWYTGCSNCAILRTAMQPVYDHYENNSNVVFVSVSIDESRTQWIKSIKSGKYSHRKTVNLFTGGRGAKDSLIKYYEIASYPTVKIIKDGTMFSAVPPTPTLTGTSQMSEGAVDLIETIEKALADNKRLKSSLLSPN